jgi:RNA ligase
MEQLDRAILSQYVKDKLITETKHPTLDIYIYNYTSKCEYDHHWDDITRICRGLILDAEGYVIARPFPKFFNYEEYKSEQIPKLPYEITEKLDGSLGIIYWNGEMAYLATRGQFQSPQAEMGTYILQSKYMELFHKLDRNLTYLFEIIYPENRNVIDYGNLKDIYLIGILNTKTGEDLDIYEFGSDLGFPMPELYTDYADIDFYKMHDLNLLNKEGFVVNFQNDKQNVFRMKVKFSEYLTMFHAIMRVSVKSIWKAIRDKVDMDEVVGALPEDLKNRASALIERLNLRYKDEEASLAKIYKNVYARTYGKGMSRKEFSKIVYNDRNFNPVKGVLFAMLDNKDYERIIWNILEEEIMTWEL